MSIELTYILLLFGLLIIPRMLQRFRLPPPITALGFGILCGMGLDAFIGDETINLLATFGIAALFLFAGLEVDGAMLLRKSKALVVHLVIGIVALLVVSFAVGIFLNLEWRAAILIGLALLTPSTGFILNTLDSLGVTEEEKLWIKAKAISTELIALVVLFVTLKSTSAVGLTASGAALIAMVILLPLVFRFFSAHIAPIAPNSEYAFLLMVAVVCAYVTRQLGVYYLVGAFLVGIAAQRFRHQSVELSSERMFQAVQVFASFFVPFYFFHAGLEIPREAFGLNGVLLGIAFLAMTIPLRILISLTHRCLVLREKWRKGIRVAVPLLPTLVFTLVLATILRERFEISPAIFGGLVIYAVGTTLIPGFVFRQKPPEYDDLDVLSWERVKQRYH